ncbi:hypothetical protein HMPREF0239_02484 [Clostridium sp. ATCC BAA-442]|uniref:Uncharacterized protein n=1 Tax=Flavonifractor plautii ATCC 29863 TaxID=411475 RepID=G9YRD5_FLAPL|nr:hypothetical protein HMPREF0372_02080 [Flavonifractor plautii ATCC 29863]ERI75589.1 hypothetical protein HMPREF0239_02484 [Clostridium sp. ATCC BAA-442]
MLAGFLIENIPPFLIAFPYERRFLGHPNGNKLETKIQGGGEKKCAKSTRIL